MALQTKPAEGLRQPPPPPEPAVLPLRFSEWLAAVGVALLLQCGAALMIRHVELVTGRYISAGVPPILAIASLLLLLGVRAGVARVAGPRARFLDRRQLLIVFSMLCLGLFVNGQYCVRAFLPHLVTLQYWPTHGNPSLTRWTEYLPRWYAPADVDAALRFYEGARGAGVPWELWVVPLLRWSLFFIAFFLVAVSLMALFRRQWLHHERLSFPLQTLPLALTSGGEGAVFDGHPLLRHPLLWTGVAIAATFNAFNIGRALNPVIPAPGFSYSFRGQFPDAPWTPLNSFNLYYMVESIGFGYLIPLEVSFSTWFFYLVEKAVGIGGLAAGYEAPGFPYLQDQSAGAYLGVAALVLYAARRHLSGIFGRAFARARRRETEDEREERYALYVFLGASAFLGGWAWLSGFSLLIAGPFFALLLCFMLVYARLRAETGVPFEFGYPYGLSKEMLVNALSARGVLDVGGPRSWVVFSSFAWLSRHHYPLGITAYSVDAMKLAEETRVDRRWFYGALAVALVAGYALACWSHLEAYAAVGANLAGGGKIEYRASVALQEFQRMATLATGSVPRDDGKLAAQVAGGGIALFLGFLRTVWIKSPFHPLGFIIATAYGDHTTSFLPMLVAWICKSLVLRLGGLALYRRFLPLFLGLVLGHYAIGGILWPLLSLTLAPEASQSYHLYFGG